MDYRELFDAVCKRPEMFGLDRKFQSSFAFIEGYDLGNDGCILTGFREWLVVKLNNGNNLGWKGLVLNLAFRDKVKNIDIKNLSEAEEDQARKSMFSLLFEFLEIRDRSGIIFLHKQYLEWLKSQDWYDPHYLT